MVLTMSEDKKPHPVDVHVGGRVRLRRTMLGISQDKLGEGLGLTFQQVQKYEKGVNRIGASRLFEISHLLNVPVQFFYDGFASMERGVYGFAEGETDDDGGAFMNLLKSPEGIQLCKAFAEIGDPKVRRRVVDLVKTLADGAKASAQTENKTVKAHVDKAGRYG
jgi:transcriptional regulator with XRE-family HTH domain